MKILALSLTLAAAPALAAGTDAGAAALGAAFSASLEIPAAPVPEPSPASPELKAPASSWAEAAKAAAEREIEAGGFTGFADILELPPGARRCLEREWEVLPEGPGNSSEAFRLNVAGRTAFVVQSYIYSDSMRLFIFDAAGNPVAYGEGSVDRDFAWLPFPAGSKAPASPWTEAAKAAFEREMDLGGLTAYADLKELPPGARRCLERELKILPQGPGNSSEAFKLAVEGRTAFVVQSYIHSDSMRAYIFNAAGVQVAYGEGSADRDFAWLPR